MAVKILIADDEQSQLDLIQYHLVQNGYEVVIADNGQTALTLIEVEKPDMVILDWMMPELSGVDLCRLLRAREETKHLPIIMLSARAAGDDRSLGLERGADDYIAKPFYPKELLARIKSLLRRARPSLAGDVLTFQDVEMDLHKIEVRRAGKVIKLSAKEFRLLSILMERPTHVYSREHLLDLVWGHDVYVEDRTVDVHMSRLRKALRCGDDGEKSLPDIIRTVRNMGYALKTSQ